MPDPDIDTHTFYPMVFCPMPPPMFLELSLKLGSTVQPKVDSDRFLFFV